MQHILSDINFITLICLYKLTRTVYSIVKCDSSQTGHFNFCKSRNPINSGWIRKSQMKKNQNPARRFMLKLGAGMVLAALPLTKSLADVLSELSSNAMVTIEEFSSDGKSTGAQRVAKIIKTDAEWRASLPAEVYGVTRLGEPDHPYTGSLWNARSPGIYRCICCGAALFDSDSKFESGTGWPSFWQPISALNINREHDLFGCSRCDAHIGVVVADGPEPTGLRFSARTLALKFEARA